MIILLGKSLIRRQEAALFTSFFISIRPLTELFYVEPLLIECLQNHSLECLVPIFALCSGTHLIRNSVLYSNGAQSVTRRDWDRECPAEEPSGGVTLAQIRATEQLRKTMLL